MSGYPDREVIADMEDKKRKRFVLEILLIPISNQKIRRSCTDVIAYYWQISPWKVEEILDEHFTCQDICCFYDEVESIRTFDPRIRICPSRRPRSVGAGNPDASDLRAFGFLP